MMDDTHIFPFCRQSQIVGLEEALAIVDGAAHKFFIGENLSSVVKTQIRARIAELNKDFAA